MLLLKYTQVLPYLLFFLLKYNELFCFGYDKYLFTANNSKIEVKVKVLEGAGACESSRGTIKIDIKPKGSYNVFVNEELINDYTFHPFSPGLYHIRIMNKYGIDTTISVDVPYKKPIKLNVMLTQPTCGKNNGSIIANVPQNFNKHFNFKLVGFNQQNHGNFTDLSSGMYNLVAIDSMGCSVDTVLFLLDPTQFYLAANVNEVECGLYNVVILAFGDRQTPLYYRFNNTPFQSSNFFSNLKKGEYIFNVKDSLGCSKSITVVIE
jgi:hypothetical protein